VPIVAVAIVCAALFVPESRAVRARRFDPVAQTLMILVLGSVVYAIIESRSLGWSSPVMLGLLVVAVLGVLGILAYEPRPAAPLPAVLAIYLLFGVFLGTVNPPITNTAVSGMPRSMAGVATSLASAGRQTGTTLGVAISGTIVGSALDRGGVTFTHAEHGV